MHFQGRVKSYRLLLFVICRNGLLFDPLKENRTLLQIVFVVVYRFRVTISGGSLHMELHVEMPCPQEVLLVGCGLYQSTTANTTTGDSVYFSSPIFFSLSLFLSFFYLF
jgi:hypothetical protein